ncbi:MAG: hypothetical protein NTX50_22745 [Candidatus Sumerlaeota bacterium]|nr:hypothetical protein [Candidatus Sumerlaeota bacterium]
MTTLNEEIQEIIKAIDKCDQNRTYLLGFRILCENCHGEFAVDGDIISVITCPYCGEYVEG